MMARQLSIGTERFAERLADAQVATAEDETAYPALEDNDDKEVGAGGHEELHPPPEGTQHDYEPLMEYDEAEKEEASEKFPDLHAKTWRMKELLTKKATIMNNAGPNPHDLMANMHDMIERAEDGTDKSQDIAMYNAINAIYESSRTNSDLRNFLADLFGAQRGYYNDKEQLDDIGREFTLLSKLYEKQEMQQMQEKVVKNREARMAALEVKASEKAKKNAEKDAKKESKKPRVK